MVAGNISIENDRPDLQEDEAGPNNLEPVIENMVKVEDMQVPLAVIYIQGNFSLWGHLPPRTLLAVTTGS
jgi:hypothetical protein